MEDSFFLEKGSGTSDEEVEPPSEPVCLTSIPRLNLVPQPSPVASQISVESLDSANLRSEPHGGVDHFSVSPIADNFRKRVYSNATKSEWNDWHWQLHHRIQELDELARIIELSDDERTAIVNHTGHFAVRWFR